MARELIDWLFVRRGADWVDQAIGTGAVTDVIVERKQPGSLVAIDPSIDVVRATHGRHAGARTRFLVSGPEEIPTPDGSADAIVSGLAIERWPDPAAAIAEAVRVARAGAVVAASAWDRPGMEPFRRFWEAAVAFDRAAAAFDDMRQFPVARKEALERLFTDAGLEDVEVRPLEVPLRFKRWDEFWTPFLAGAGPAPRYAATLDPWARSLIAEEMQKKLAIARDGSFRMTVRALAVRGTRER